MKNKIVTGILAFFGGFIGIHRFYLGQVGRGILSVLFMATGIPAIIGFIDGIIFLTMDDDDFNEKYNKAYMDNQRKQYRKYDHRDREKRYEDREDRFEERQRERQRQRELERERYEQRERERKQNTYHPRQNQPIRPKTNKFKDEGTRLYREYDFKGAIEQYRKSLEVQSRDPQIHFNLACLYSLMEDREHSYFHLSKAVEQGYNDFDRIRSHDHLAYLRTDDNFEIFIKNGYKILPKEVEQPKAEENTPQIEAPKQDVLELDENVAERLKMLAELRDKGILTEEEFQKQKEIMLRK